MARKEWALVVFTLLVQTAVGLFLLSGAAYGLSWRQETPVFPGPVTALAFFLTLGMLAVGAGAATFHLALPLRALRAMANLRSSWLSREMLLGGMFGLLVLTVTLCHTAGTGRALEEPLAVVAAFVGAGFVYAVSRLYRLRTVPAWNTPVTTLSFFITTLLLGSATYGGTAVLVETLAAPICPAVPVGFLPVLGWAVVGLAAAQAIVPALKGAGDPERSGHRPAHALRVVLAIVGAGLLCYVLHQPHRSPLVLALFCAAFCLLLASETLGRIMFYAAYRRPLP